ncbi:MAG: hypothetical protein AseanaTS_28600 [Candidatus Pelagadaptatus aseana]|uniref:DUF1269 domain-containing protein n=1 Tax=Candidatus Pelagadaptatus aseana TaxID=3120508 RepID=UPI0039B17279
MNKMLVAVFDNETDSFAGLTSLKALHRDGDITLYATAVIEKSNDESVNIKQATSENGAATATGLLTGSLIGLLAGPAGVLVGASIGTLTGMLVDLREAGIDVEFIDEVSGALSPGKVAIVADIDESWTVPVDTRLAEQGATLFRRLRSEVAEDQLNREMEATVAELEALEDEMASASDSAKQAINQRKDTLNKKMQATRDAAQQKYDDLKADTDARVAALETQISEAKDSKRKKLEKRKAKLEAEAEIRMAKLKNLLNS